MLKLLKKKKKKKRKNLQRYVSYPTWSLKDQQNQGSVILYHLRGEGGGGISGDHMVFKENGEGICRGQQSIKRGLLTIDCQLTVQDRGS